MPDFAAFDWKRPDYDAVWRERAIKLEAIRREPARLQPLKDFYRDHPVEFINDWGCTFDPRNAGTDVPTTMPFLLFPRQREFVEWLFEKLKNREPGGVEKSRDMGISWLCVAAAVHWWLFEPGFVSGFGSRKEDLVDKSNSTDALFWKARTYIDLLPREFKPARYRPDTHAPHMLIVNPENGARIIGEAGKNIGRGGRTTIYFKDESAYYEENAKTIDAALSQNTNVEIDISTPNGEGNPFWEKMHSGKISKFVFDWHDDPRKDQAWYEDQVRRKNAMIVAAEIDRDYSASISNSWISGDIVQTAQFRGPADVRPIGPLMVGLDVARFGDDSSVLTFRRGRVLLKQVKRRKSDLESVAGWARAEIAPFKEIPAQIAVDVVGLGAGVVDMMTNYAEYRLDEYGRQHPEGESVVVGVNSGAKLDDGENLNMRSRMWAEMKEWLKTASIPRDNELRASLTSTRYFYSGGLLQMESKEQMKKRGIKSPDEADSLALTFAIPPTRKTRGVKARDVVQYPSDALTGM